MKHLSPKQKWLLDRLLIPAGIIPPLVTIDDLNFNEDLRRSIGNQGFEYFYILDQDHAKLNQSAIGSKIHALHAPWHGFPPVEKFPGPIKKILTEILLGNRQHSKNLSDSIEKSLQFALKIGAKIVTTHIVYFDHQNIDKELSKLAALEEKYGLPIAIEHEGNYLHDYLKRGYQFKKIDGDLDWMINPAKLLRTLHQFYPKKLFKLCLDTASLRNFDLPILETVKPIFDQIIHYHLADNPIGGPDLALEIKTPEIAQLVDFLYEKKYQGLITAEIGGTDGSLIEESLARIYAASAILGFPIFKKTVTTTAQHHIANSCHFLLNNSAH